MEINQKYETHISEHKPLGQAICTLPGQYIKVLTRPSVSALLVNLVERHRKELEKELA